MRRNFIRSLTLANPERMVSEAHNITMDSVFILLVL